MKKLLSILIAIAMMATMSVTVFAAETTYYGLWVAGVQITSANLVIDRSDNENIEGSATFDEATMTLTLTDFKCTGAYCPDDAYESSVIRVTQDGITIVFFGENMITGTGDCGLQADVYGNIKLEAADENSTLTFICENTGAFLHRPELVGDIDIYAGSNEDDATLLAYDIFTEDPYSYEYVRFVPAKPEPEIKSTTVTYEVAPTYTVTIPATVTLGETAKIEVENVVVEKGKQVEVALTEANDFKVATTEGAELTYTVKNGETEVAEGDTVLAVNPKDGKTGETTLSFVAPTEIQYAGTYTGSATFTIAVKPVPKTIINFTMDSSDVEEWIPGLTANLQAEAGMTWGEWVESEYNVDDYVMGDWGIIPEGEDWVAVCDTQTDELVEPTDEIIADHTYTLLQMVG